MHSKAAELQLLAFSCPSVHIEQLNIIMYGGLADRVVSEEIVKSVPSRMERQFEVYRSLRNMYYEDKWLQQGRELAENRIICIRL